MVINKTTYNKTTALAVGKGYSYRPSDVRSIVVHTTNGRKGSSLHDEASYLMRSLDVSAHYLIGKQGQIIQLLDPAKYAAWHAGCVKQAVFGNNYSIGIEIHHTPSEGNITDAQKTALTELVRYLKEVFKIPNEHIERHRAVAVYCKGHALEGQLGRKIDPSGFTDQEFITWRNNLEYRKYKVISPRGVYVRQSPQVNKNNIAGVLEYGDTFVSDVVKLDELGQTIAGSNLWAHILSGTTQSGIKVDHLGFVHCSNLKEYE